MSSRETVSGAVETDVAVARADRRGAEASPAAVAQAAQAGRLAPTDVLRLQRMVGNQAVARIASASRRLQRASPEERPMVDPAAGEGGFTDEAVAGPAGDRFVWDYFDRTFTIFTSPNGPFGGKAYQITYKESATNLATDVERVEELSLLRAEALEWLRTAQGKYQETASARKTRVDNAQPGKKPTLCYQHTGALATVLSDGTEKGMGGMDPRSAAIKGKRGGAFHTLESRPKGPRPGDIISYGQVNPAKKPGGLREANFFTILHIGVFKSRRAGPGGTEIWTVVDGGQGKFESRQETRERTRTFVKEKLLVSIPKTFHQSGPNKGQPEQWDKPEELECGVLKSKKADAGQSADDKLLRGWLDIDEYFGGGGAPAETSAGVMNRVFVGKKQAAAALAAQT